MTVNQLWTELESDMAWRQDEVRLLSNSSKAIARALDRDRFRRAMVVMLYAHIEGFCKVAFTAYAREVNRYKLRCKDAIDCIAAASFDDVFHALKFGDKKTKVFRSSLPSDEKLAIFARHRDFFKELQDLLDREVSLADTVVDTENNLGAIVLRRNLFRLGFAANLLEQHEPALDELKNRRNNIAHGTDDATVREADYERLQRAAFEAMDEITLAIIGAVEKEEFKR